MVQNWSNLIINPGLIFSYPTIPPKTNRFTIPNIPPNPPLNSMPNFPNRLPKVRTISGWQLIWQIFQVHSIFRKQHLRPQTFWIDSKVSAHFHQQSLIHYVHVLKTQATTTFWTTNHPPTNKAHLPLIISIAPHKFPASLVNFTFNTSRQIRSLHCIDWNSLQH